MVETQLLTLTLDTHGKTQAKINCQILSKLEDADIQLILAQVHVVNELLVEALKK